MGDCGLFGIYGHKNAADLAYLGLYSLQHRGQESAGIVVSDHKTLRQHKGLGLVTDVFSDPATLKELAGDLAVGHTRYSTTGSPLPGNIQPLLVNCKGGPLAIAHNGNLVNSNALRHKLEQEGSLFQTTVDSEVIIHLTARSQREVLLQRMIEALRQVRGAYSILAITKDKIIAVRDPHGFRPLCLGKLGDAWVVASESCALDIIGGKYCRDVEPGEIVILSEDGLSSIKPFGSHRYAFCIFEYIYFSRPDSKVFGENVDKARRRLGRQLAVEHPAQADIVISVPDSSNTAALGYSESSGIKFELGLIRNHYIGRTFIEPRSEIRDIMVRIKFNPVSGLLKGKSVVVVEDSIVRGTTMRNLAGLIREAGAKEVHVRVSCPPLRFPCYYGIDFQTKDELIASSKTVEQIRNFLRVDSLGYLSLEAMLEAMPGTQENYCVACFTGDYPVEPEEKVGKFLLEKNRD